MNNKGKEGEALTNAFKFGARKERQRILEIIDKWWFDDNNSGTLAELLNLINQTPQTKPLRSNADKSRTSPSKQQSRFDEVAPRLEKDKNGETICKKCNDLCDCHMFVGGSGESCPYCDEEKTYGRSHSWKEKTK